MGYLNRIEYTAGKTVKAEMSRVKWVKRTVP